MSDEDGAIRRDVAAEPSRASEERAVPGTREPQEPPGTEAGNAQYDERTLHDTGLKDDWHQAARLVRGLTEAARDRVEAWIVQAQARRYAHDPLDFDATRPGL